MSILSAAWRGVAATKSGRDVNKPCYGIPTPGPVNLVTRLDTQHTLRRRDIRRRFDRAADSFDDADFVHRETRDGLFARLSPVVVDADVVVDLGSATGNATAALAKRFRGAQVVAVDLSHAMLRRCRDKRSWFSKVSVVQADALALPLADQSVDVVFSNLLLPWITDPAAIAAEVARVLRKDGLFAFSTLGPDSLLELREAWRQIDNYEHVNRFLDMHDVGDALVRAGLRDPVLDVDRLTVSYDDTHAVFRDLTANGGRNALEHRSPGLHGRSRFRAMQDALEATRVDGRFRLDLELVYGHCWGGGPRRQDGQIRIDAGSIPVRKA